VGHFQVIKVSALFMHVSVAKRKRTSWASFSGAYVDGILVGTHLAAAAAELEEGDQSKR
jgi:hypothetical protein